MKDNKLYYFKISSRDLKIKRNNIIHLLGYKEINKISKKIIKKTDYYINKCIDISNPSGCYILKNKIKIDQKKGSIKINDMNFRIGEKIVSQFKYTDSIAIFIGTVGKEIETFSKNLLNNNKYLEGYIVDLIGSEIAEAVADYLHIKITNNAKSMKLNTTNRFSPGYCEWDVIEQFKLFSFFPDNTCDISLTEKGLMKPIKSVSGIIGIGEKVVFKNTICELCGQKSCIFRTVKNKIESF